MREASAKLTAIGLFGLCSWLSGACTKDGDISLSDGNLVIPFELGNDRTCDAVGVKYVRAVLDDGEYDKTVPCDNGEVRFTNIHAGAYDLEMYGLDDDKVAVMDSVAAGDLTVDVVGDGSTTIHKPDVTLTAAPAKLLVRWNFGFGTCKGLGIDRFVVKVWRGTGDDLLLSKDLPCEEEGHGTDQYREVADPDRRLGGDDVGEASVQAFDKADTAIGKPATFRFKAPGPGQAIKLSVTCSDDACRSSGTPD
jgi:hypothetical protein